MHDFGVDPVSSAFGPMLGMPSWLVAQGHGSFVTMEFGEPQLVFETPSIRPLRIEGAPSRARVRRAHVQGQWHLWIYCCEWSLALEDVQLAHCESDDLRILRSLRVLNGQALTAVNVSPAD